MALGLWVIAGLSPGLLFWGAPHADGKASEGAERCAADYAVEGRHDRLSLQIALQPIQNARHGLPTMQQTRINEALLIRGRIFMLR